MGKHSIASFSGMPGVRRKRLRGPIVGYSVTEFMAQLRNYRTVSAAGDHGSVMVYRDDAGKFRCAFCRWTQVIDSQTFDFKKQVRQWLANNLPRMKDIPHGR